MFAPFDLTGKVALVTGGNSGIGLGMATGLAQAGASVCVWGTNAEKNAQAERALTAIAPRARAIRCDVSDEAQVEAAFQQTLEIFGKVDGCFANAAIAGGSPAPFGDFETARWRRLMAINLDGVFYTLRAAARHLLERAEGGTLAATTSTNAILGGRGLEAYGATKGGVISLIRSLAVELARHGITANAIMPGYIETPMSEGALSRQEYAAKLIRRIPARRWGQPSDFAGLAVYLMSDASRYHTGDTFVIDGAFSIA